MRPDSQKSSMAECPQTPKGLPGGMYRGLRTRNSIPLIVAIYSDVVYRPSDPVVRIKQPEYAANPEQAKKRNPESHNLIPINPNP